MKKARKQFIAPLPCDQGTVKESGFALAEFLISTVIVLGLSAGVFTMLTNVLSTSGYQTEVLSVMENTRVAMGTLERYIVQAGNNPRSAWLRACDHNKRNRSSALQRFNRIGRRQSG